MKMNQNLAMVIVVCSCVTLPVAAGQTETYNDGKLPGDRDSAAKVAYNDLAKANKIIGMEVTDPQEHQLGKVKDLAIDMQAGRIAEVIVGTGGFIGLDEKMIAVPPESFVFANAGKELKLNDAAAFKIAPVFKMSQWQEATSAAKVADACQRFQVPPYDGSGPLERADKILGLTAKNPQSEHLGKVENLVVDLSAGRVVEVIIATGGFLGIKDELSAVPPQAFRFDPGRNLLTLDTTREALKNAPHFKPADWRDSVNNSASLAGVYNAYSVPPYFTQGSADTALPNAVPRKVTPPANAADTQSDAAITLQIQQLLLTADGLSAGCAPSESHHAERPRHVARHCRFQGGKETVGRPCRHRGCGRPCGQRNRSPGYRGLGQHGRQLIQPREKNRRPCPDLCRTRAFLLIASCKTHIRAWSQFAMHPFSCPADFRM